MRDPFAIQRLLWPHVYFYSKQREVIAATLDSDEVYVPAANMTGKDFVAAYIVLEFFLTRHPCRIITTSAKGEHLGVLFGEINRFIQTAKYPLDVNKGGPLRVMHQDIRKVYGGEECPLSYLRGMVAAKDSLASMQGHHIAKTGDGIKRTMALTDESSSVSDDYYRMMSTWMDVFIAIGNPWDCQNYFRRAVDAGDLRSADGRRTFRKIVRIRAEDSPNVRFGLAQRQRGIDPTDEVLVPGVLTYGDYVKRREIWDKYQQCVSLDGLFYSGAEIALFPAEWRAAAMRRRPINLGPFWMGVDPAEGGDKSAWVVINRQGVVRLVSIETPDTTVVTSKTLALMQEYGIDASHVCFDRGGGGKEHADRLRLAGFPVRSVGFGETVSLPLKRGLVPMSARRELREDKYAYANRRAQMYHELRLLLDPASEAEFCVPPGALDFQMSKIPLTYDQEGSVYLMPKGRKEGSTKGKCLIDLVGHSPDELDALVLAVHAMKHPDMIRMKAGVGSTR